MSDLSLEAVLDWFTRISQVPRTSGDEERLSTQLLEHARARGLQAEQDTADNLVIRKPAHPGQEDRPSLALQAHLDMVGAKESGSPHDFATDPIQVIRDADVLRAEGTTLGADDGIGVAIAMALLDSTDVRHPALEVLLTTGEEVGLVGAKALARGVVQSRSLLNLDGEAEGVFLVSCAGGATYDVTFPLGAREPAGPAYEVALSGLAGGHSGLDIDKGRVNGARAMAELLIGIAGDPGDPGDPGGPGDPGAAGEPSHDVRLATFDAPGAFNAINREARAVFATTAPGVSGRLAAWQPELATRDAGATVAVRELDGDAECVDAATSAAVLAFLAQLPDGVATMSPHLPGIVESSLNTGVVRQDGDALVVTLSTRSSDALRHAELAGRVDELAARYGGSVRVYGQYPAWQFDPDNTL